MKAADARRALASDWLLPEPFPGGQEMLAEAHRLGLRTVLLSNTAWQSADDYRKRLRQLGIGRLNAVVSSLDVGVREPDRRMFEAALERAGSGPDACVMIGDSEEKDIEPAMAFGIRAIWVTVQYTVVGSTRATALAASLSEVTGILRRWAVG
jgi:FMN phosphatase YigB (HAD superfamily)